MKAFIPLLSTLTLVAWGCGNGSSTELSEPRDIELKFAAVAGSGAVACGQDIAGLGSGHVKARLLDFALYLHDLKFFRSDGALIAFTLEKNSWQGENVVLLDFQDKSDNCAGADKPVRTVVKGRLESLNDLHTLQFSLGVPGQRNHADPTTQAAPLNATNMFWSWQSGYKSMRLDLEPAGGISRPSDPDFLGTNYFFHLGSTNCTGNPVRGEPVKCERLNQPIITLSGFDAMTREVAIDIAALVGGLDLNVDTADAPGCMASESDPECASYFEKLGLNLVSGGTAAGVSQSVFSVR